MKLKLFIWLLTAAFLVVCASCWVVSELVVKSMMLTMQGVPMPWFTLRVITSHGWILFCPIPWVVCSITMSLRRELSASAALVFGGTLLLAGSVLVSAVVIALILPYIQRLG
jgi:hypothetical protein